MKLINKSENQIVFSVEIDETLANAIRRHITQIPILAADELEISKNDSPLYDETIAHRVGLIPLKTDKNANPKGKLTLNVKKPGIVYSEELKGKSEPVYGKIPLTILDKGQELELKATLKLGLGTEHSKFSPGLMFYRRITELTMDKELSEEIKKICPNNEIKEKGQKIILKDDQKKEITDVCEGLSEKKEKAIEIKPEKDLIITVESFGQIDVNDVFKKSIEILKKDLKEVSKQTK